MGHLRRRHLDLRRTGPCSDASWINPVAASITVDPQGRTLSLATSSGSLHPTPDGQQSGYEAAFLAAGMSKRS